MVRVGFLGLGRMGAPMAANLAAAGHDLILYNRTSATADAVARRLGARVAADPREAAEQAEIVITMVADEGALLAVCDGDRGVLAGLRHGSTLIDMGTTGPAGIARLAPRVDAAGGVLVDAPVSGSTAAAQAGALTVLVGATAETFGRLEALLAAMGERILHVGTTGAGSVAKLAVNNVIYALGNALSESLVLAERAGLDRDVVYDVFEHSAISAPMVRYRRDAFLDPDGTPTAFAMTLARKDLGLITELAVAVGVEVDQAVANRSVYDRAIDAGLGARDMAEVAVYLRGRAGRS
jgi:3-hydroxyisobutyrate dehydrogenase